MTPPASHNRNRLFIFGGLTLALAIAVLVSPFASSNPDGLDRVAEDHQFADQALEDAPAQKLPFYNIFDEYALRGVPENLATPLAGLIGTLATFGVAWTMGKLAIRASGSSQTLEAETSLPDDRDRPLE